MKRDEVSRREFFGLGGLAMGLLAVRCGTPAAPTPSPIVPTGSPAVPAETPVPVATATGGIKRGGRFILGTPQPIETLDPHAFGIYNNRNAWPGLWNGLVWYDRDMNPKPDLAEEWEMSEDGLTWTFKLREGVKFHNGREMTADDVKFSVERVLKPEQMGGPYADFIKEVESAEVADPYTVVLHLKSPSAILLPGLCRVMIVAKENEAEVANNAIGTGPYKLNEYVVGDRLVLDRFDDYWAGMPYMDGVTVKTRGDPVALFTDLTTGTVDAYWQMEPKFVGQLARYPDLEASFAPHSSVVTYLQVNNEAAPFNDLRARQGLLYAIDRDTMNQLAFFGTATMPTGNSFLPKGHPFAKPDPKEWPYDPQKAKELFDAVGVTELGYIGLDIVPWTKVIGEVLERAFHEIGITVTIEMLDLSGWLAQGYPITKPGAIFPNAALPDYDAGCIWALADPAVNQISYKSEEFARLLAEGRSEVDPEARKEIYWALQDQWDEDAPQPIICHDRWFHGVNTRVKDLLHINSGDLDYRETWLAE